MRLRGRCGDPIGTKGAVLVEFALAIVPLLITFFTILQLAMAYTANIVVRHATYMAARTAAVVLPPNPGDVGEPKDVDRAVHRALGRWDGMFRNVEVIKTPAKNPYELVTVEVRATYECRIPLGGRIMCGVDGLFEMRPIVAQYPNQGARYVR